MAKRKKVIPAPPVKRREGRPTLYHPGLCDDIIEFFDRPLYIKKIERKNIDGDWAEVEHEVPNRTPFLIHWVLKHNICMQTPHNWCVQHPEFLVAYNKAKALQENFLVEHGVKGDHNGFMTFQTLKNVAGWRDKQEVKHSGGVVSATVDVEGKSPEELIRLLNGH